jgi:hypothetical protein
MKLYEVVEKERMSKHGKRKLTMLDMAIIKQDEATHNARIKRGLIEKGYKHIIYMCGCGAPGCAIHTECKEVLIIERGLIKQS